MTDQSPEPRDPWAPPERPAVELGTPQATPGVSGSPSVHDQPTIAGMPGADAAPGQIPAPAPTPIPAPAPTPAPAAMPPAYGYPAQPDPGGYAYPGPPPAQPAYGYAGYQGYPGYPVYQPKSNGFGVTALVLGIIGVVTCYLGLLFGVPAVIFGALGRGKARRGEADNGPMALAGIILGAVGIVISILMIGLVIAGVLLGDRSSGSDFDGPPSRTHVREKV